jgi:hypothetical protein
VRASPDGELLRLGDIADVELGSEFFDIYSNLDGHHSAAIVLKQTYGSNATEVIENVKGNRSAPLFDNRHRRLHRTCGQAGSRVGPARWWT